MGIKLQITGVIIFIIVISPIILNMWQCISDAYIRSDKEENKGSLCNQQILLLSSIIAMIIVATIIYNVKSGVGRDGDNKMQYGTMVLVLFSLLLVSIYIYLLNIK